MFGPIVDDNEGETDALRAETYQKGAKQRDIDVLVKLLPYYDIDLSLKKSDNSKEANDAHYLRRLLTISRSDADMIFK